MTAPILLSQRLTGLRLSDLFLELEESPGKQVHEAVGLGWSVNRYSLSVPRALGV